MSKNKQTEEEEPTVEETPPPEEVAATIEETPPPEAWSAPDTTAGPEQAAQQNADTLEGAMELQQRLAEEANPPAETEAEPEA